MERRRIEDLNRRQFSELEILTILVQFMKNYIYSIIYATIALIYIHNSEESNHCSSQGTYFVMIVVIGSIFMAFMSLALFGRYNQLRGGDFIVLYIINAIYFVAVIGYIVYQIFFNEKECNTYIVFEKALVYIWLKKEVEIGSILYTRSLYWIRQIGISTNCAFIMIIYSSADQSFCNPDDSLYNNLINITNIAILITYTLMNIIIEEKNQQIQIGVLKITCGILISIQIYSYLRLLGYKLLEESLFSVECVPILYGLDSYIYIIPTDLIAMILIHFLIFKLQKNNITTKTHNNNYVSQQSYSLLNQNKSLKNNQQIYNSHDHF